MGVGKGQEEIMRSVSRVGLGVVVCAGMTTWGEQESGDGECGGMNGVSAGV